MKPDKADQTTKEIFDLYRNHGANNYLGEDVTQQEHMIQCAMLAERSGYPDEVILGALFHDIGHLLGLANQLEAMAKGIGTKRHDVIGAQYLANLGFPETLCELVKHHVNAKRYLVHKREGYHDQLSDASKQTLIHQGGPMGAEEAAEFEKLKNFKAIIELREWDDHGKIEGKESESIDKYVEMCRKYLVNLM